MPAEPAAEHVGVGKEVVGETKAKARRQLWTEIVVGMVPTENERH